MRTHEMRHYSNLQSVTSNRHRETAVRGNSRRFTEGVMYLEGEKYNDWEILSELDDGILRIMVETFPEMMELAEAEYERRVKGGYDPR